MAAAGASSRSCASPSSSSSEQHFHRGRLLPASSFKWEDAEKWVLPLPESPSVSTCPDYKHGSAAPKTSTDHHRSMMIDTIAVAAGEGSATRQHDSLSDATAMAATTAENRKHVSAAAEAIAIASAEDRTHYSAGDGAAAMAAADPTSASNSRHISAATAAHLRSNYNVTYQHSGSFAFQSPSPSPPSPDTPAPPGTDDHDAFHFFHAGIGDQTPSISLQQKPKPLDSPDWNHKPSNAVLKLQYYGTTAPPPPNPLVPAASIYYNGAAAAMATSSCAATLRSLSANMRDMGTEMTPMASQEPSLAATPVPAATPTIHSPTSGSSASSSPQRDCHIGSSSSLSSSAAEELRHAAHRRIAGCDTASSPPDNEAHVKEELVDMVVRVKYEDRASEKPVDLLSGGGEERHGGGADSKLLKVVDLEEIKRNVLETKAVAWEEAQQARSMARFQRELARIQAWENHSKAKAEAEMRRVEVKMERIRALAHEKLVNKLAATKKRAEERRAVAETRRREQAAKASETAHRVGRTGRLRFAFVCCALD